MTCSHYELEPADDHDGQATAGEGCEAEATHTSCDGPVCARHACRHSIALAALEVPNHWMAY